MIDIDETYHSRLARCWAEGVKCYDEGGKLEDCPYSPEDEECHQEWVGGFADAAEWSNNYALR